MFTYLSAYLPKTFLEGQDQNKWWSLEREARESGFQWWALPAAGVSAYCAQVLSFHEKSYLFERIENICPCKNLYTNVRRSIIYKQWKQCKCSSAEEWVVKMREGPVHAPRG